MQSGFSSLLFFKLEFGKKSKFFCCRATIWPSSRKPPIDGVHAPVEFNSAPVELDRREGFEKLAENDWFTVLKVIGEYCSRELCE